MSEITNVRAESPFDDPSRMGFEPSAKTRKRAKSRLESEEMRRSHGQLLSWFHEERDVQSLNRYQMAVDEDYFDGLQWSPGDAQDLIERDQAPLVFNKIKPTIEWITGTEKRTRMDYKILPREEQDEQAAEVKTKILKYLSDVNSSAYAKSDAFHDAVVAGLGWIECGINTDPGEELIFEGYESWRNVLHDSKALNRNLTDGRYLFRWKWLDEDVACQLIPDRASIIKSSALTADEIAERDEDIWYMGARTNTQEEDLGLNTRSRSVRTSTEAGFSKRKRVKIIEAWYKVPVQCQVMRGSGVCDGEIYDPKNEKHQSAVDDGAVTLFTTSYMQMRVMLMTESDVLYESETPYRHNDFPLTPIWCYRRKRDGMPYGKVRDIRDAQDDFNKRASKALFILSTNQIVMDHDAVDAKDIELLRQEAARPDGIMTKRRGTELKLNQDKQLAEEHLMLMDRDAKMIQDVAGVTDENMGRKSNATSGVAIERRQEQGSVVTFGIFDNKLYADQQHGSKLLSLIEQYYTYPKVVRIVGDKKPIEWVPINQIDPQTGERINDITASKADFIVSEQDYRSSLRASATEQMLDMLGKIAPVMPQAAMNLLDLIVEMWDIPNREEFVARIRKLNGQTDPSKKPTPAEMQAQQQMQDQQQRANELNLQTLEQNLALLKAKVKDTDAAQFAKRIDGLAKAIEAATAVAQVPAITPIADVIAQGAGYQDQSGQDPNIPTATAPAMPAVNPMATGAMQ